MDKFRALNKKKELRIEKEISLETIFDEEKKFYIYSGTDTLPPCEDTI